MHFEDLRHLSEKWEAEHIVVVHLSRRTMLNAAAERIESLGPGASERIHLLMDHRANRRRYEQQLADAENKAVVKRDSESA